MDNRTVSIKGKIGTYEVDLTIGEVEPTENADTPSDSVTTESEDNTVSEATQAEPTAETPEHSVPGTVSEDA